MSARAVSSGVVPGFVLLLASGACNALFSIEEGVRVEADGGVPNGSEVDTASNGGGGAMTDLVPVTFRARTASHPSVPSGLLLAFHSALGTTIAPDCADTECFSAQTGSEVCVSGTTEPIPNEDYANYFGAGLQILFANTFAEPPTPPWDRGSGPVLGLSFVITGTGLDNLTFGAGTPSTAEQMYPRYAVELAAISGAQYDILFALLKQGWWDPATATALPDRLPLTNVGWEIGAVPDRAKTFAFCVSDIRPIVAAEVE